MRILVADDHWVVRAGLGVLLGQLDQPATVVEAGTLDQALAALAEDSDIDLIIIDPMIASADPFKGLGDVCRAKKGGAVVVFSKSDSRQHLLQSLEVGAMGYIPKTAARDDILAALKWVMSGKIWIPPALLDPGRTDPAEPRESPPRQPFLQDQGVLSLTTRQKEVLVLLAEGKSNSQIAETLGISEGTVRVHVSAILRVLNVNNRTQAALLAMNRRPG